MVVISKRKLVNGIFILAFPWYGVGTYLIVKKGFSEGLVFCTIPFVLILVFHAVDLLYRRTFTPVINRNFWLCGAATLSAMLSVPLGLYYGSPILNPGNVVVVMIYLAVPFLSAVVVQVYNRGPNGTDMGWLMVKGLLWLVVVNLLGYAGGIRNLLHSFEGRISLPFTLGIYDAAHFLAFLNLILLGHLRDFKSRPTRFALLSAVYVFNLAMMLSINSRLSIMIFLVLSILFVTRAAKATKGLFVISLFTMPILINFALLVYKILSLPFLASIVERVSKQDVTTFNGRTYIWESAADWILHDRRGLIFGNGFNGQYHLRLLDHVAQLWGEPHSYNLHMHSSFLEILVNQGLVGLFLMYAVLWTGYRYYRRQFIAGSTYAPVYAGFIYLLFIWQIDIFCYGYKMGYLLLFVMMAPLAVKPLNTPAKPG